MIRSAAKNHGYVAVCTEIADIARGAGRAGGGRRPPASTLRKRLAARAFARTAAYDAAISTWFAGQLGDDVRRSAAPSPASWSRPCAMARTRTRRRPSTASPTRAPASPPPASCRARSSATTTSTTPTRPSSWWPSSTRRTARPAPSSSTPIPAAWPPAQTLKEAYRAGAGLRSGQRLRRHHRLNRTLDAATADEIVKIFTEVVIAPDADDDAIALFAQKKNLRLLIDRRPARPAGARR